MRLTGLLALLLFILILFFATSAASFAQTATNNPAAGPTEKTNVAELNSQNLAELARRSHLGSEFERDGVCYSDATRMVRATRCLPAWKLEFKSAIAPALGNEDSRPATR